MSGRRKRLVVLNGANLDMLGKRAKEHYGTVTLKEVERLVQREATSRGWRCLCVQTNHEGRYIELLHKYRNEDALIVNPGAWTHYSYAIRDALEIVKCPVAEVHLSDISQREEWRRHSVISKVVQVTVMGKGPEGYAEAAGQLASLVERGDVGDGASAE